jgi:hypothetical protein
VTRTFRHEFEPTQLNRIGPNVQLTSAEIEQAGLLEVLQTPGARLMSGALLESLLSQSSNNFLFNQQLGQAREVKVALSGLLGRFVARAYLTRHHGYTIYGHLSSSPVVLHGGQHAQVVRNARGDLPDWVVWHPGNRGLAIAEAKGSHDPHGPFQSLERAWTQAQRVDLLIAGHSPPLKRFAVATRWGVENSDLSEPIIAVRDPEERGDATPEEVGAVTIGLVRLHIANLLRGLGHVDLADSIDTLRTSSVTSPVDSPRDVALAALDRTRVRALSRDGTVSAPTDRLIGGIVTRAGILRGGGELSITDQEVLGRLDLGATFVGLDIELIRASIEGDLDGLIAELVKARLAESSEVRTDKAGTWIRLLDDGYLAV